MHDQVGNGLLQNRWLADWGGPSKLDVTGKLRPWDVTNRGGHQRGDGASSPMWRTWRRSTGHRKRSASANLQTQGEAQISIEGLSCGIRQD